MPGYGIVGPDEGRGLLPWSWAEERLIASHDYWVATVWPDGRPHVMPSSTIAVVDGSDLRVSEMAVAWSGVGRELRLSIYPCLQAGGRPGQPEGTCRRGLGRRYPYKLVRSPRTSSWARCDQALDSLPTHRTTSRCLAGAGRLMTAGLGHLSPAAWRCPGDLGMEAFPGYRRHHEERGCGC